MFREDQKMYHEISLHKFSQNKLLVFYCHNKINHCIWNTPKVSNFLFLTLKAVETLFLKYERKE